jgi:hypothetical protein
MVPAASVVPAAHAGRVAATLDRARAYLLGRQSPAGGFCFYRGYYAEEPNLSDTWHGVDALCNLLGITLPGRMAHAAFVIERPLAAQPLALYYRVRTLLALDVQDPQANEVRDKVQACGMELPAYAAQGSLGAALWRLQCTLWLRRHAGVPTAALPLTQALLRLEDGQGGFGMPPNLLDTAAAINLLADCHEVAGERTAEFVQRMAIPGFGFRLTAGSMSPNLETVCAGMLACARLRRPAPYAADALAFVIACQTGNGGFARAPDALPDIGLTHLALSVLTRHGSAPSGAAADCVVIHERPTCALAI